MMSEAKLYLHFPLQKVKKTKKKRGWWQWTAIQYL